MTQKSHNLIPWHGTVKMRIFLSRVLYQSFANKALQQAGGELTGVNPSAPPPPRRARVSFPLWGGQKWEEMTAISNPRGELVLKRVVPPAQTTQAAVDPRDRLLPLSHHSGWCLTPCLSNFYSWFVPKARGNHASKPTDTIDPMPLGDAVTKGNKHCSLPVEISYSGDLQW